MSWITVDDPLPPDGDGRTTVAFACHCGHVEFLLPLADDPRLIHEADGTHAIQYGPWVGSPGRPVSRHRPPVVDRVVHYLDRGACQLAIITKVVTLPTPATEEQTSLTVVMPGGVCRRITPVPQGAPGDERHWHWPEPEKRWLPPVHSGAAYVAELPPARPVDVMIIDDPLPPLPIGKHDCQHGVTCWAVQTPPSMSRHDCQHGVMCWRESPVAV